MSTTMEAVAPEQISDTTFLSSWISPAQRREAEHKAKANAAIDRYIAKWGHHPLAEGSIGGTLGLGEPQNQTSFKLSRIVHPDGSIKIQSPNVETRGHWNGARYIPAKFKQSVTVESEATHESKDVAGQLWSKWDDVKDYEPKEITDKDVVTTSAAGVIGSASEQGNDARQSALNSAYREYVVGSRTWTQMIADLRAYMVTKLRLEYDKKERRYVYADRNTATYAANLYVWQYLEIPVQEKQVTGPLSHFVNRAWHNRKVDNGEAADKAKRDSPEWVTFNEDMGPSAYETAEETGQSLLTVDAAKPDYKRDDALTRGQAEPSEATQQTEPQEQTATEQSKRIRKAGSKRHNTVRELVEVSDEFRENFWHEDDTMAERLWILVLEEDDDVLAQVVALNRWERMRSQKQMAEVIGVSEDTVNRKWQKFEVIVREFAGK